MPGGIMRSIYRQFDDVEGGGFADSDTYLPGSSPGGSTDVPDDPSWSDPAVSDSWPGQFFGPIDRQFDDTQGGGFLDVTVDRATNVGPSWLDEVTILVVVMIVLGVALWLIRPLLEIVAGVTD